MEKLSENEIARVLIKRLSEYFEIYQEVWDKSGKFRIDFIVRDKKTKVLFGIEIKKVDFKRGHDIGDLIIQSMNYSKSYFLIDGQYIKVPIFIYPPISYYLLMCPVPETMKIIEGKEYFHDRHAKEHDHHSINGMLGSLLIGEIRTFHDNFNDKKIIKFMFSNKIIWSSKPEWNDNIRKYEGYQGLHNINYDFLKKTING